MVQMMPPDTDGGAADVFGNDLGDISVWDDDATMASSSAKFRDVVKQAIAIANSKNPDLDISSPSHDRHIKEFTFTSAPGTSSSFLPPRTPGREGRKSVLSMVPAPPRTPSTSTSKSSRRRASVGCVMTNATTVMDASFGSPIIMKSARDSAPHNQRMSLTPTSVKTTKLLSSDDLLQSKFLKQRQQLQKQLQQRQQEPPTTPRTSRSTIALIPSNYDSPAASLSPSSCSGEEHSFPVEWKADPLDQFVESRASPSPDQQTSPTRRSLNIRVKHSSNRRESSSSSKSKPQRRRSLPRNTPPPVAPPPVPDSDCDSHNHHPHYSSNTTRSPSPFSPRATRRGSARMAPKSPRSSGGSRTHKRAAMGISSSGHDSIGTTSSPSKPTMMTTRAKSDTIDNNTNMACVISPALSRALSDTVDRGLEPPPPPADQWTSSFSSLDEFMKVSSTVEEKKEEIVTSSCRKSPTQQQQKRRPSASSLGEGGGSPPRNKEDSGICSVGGTSLPTLPVEPPLNNDTQEQKDKDNEEENPRTKLRSMAGRKIKYMKRGEDGGDAASGITSPGSVQNSNRTVASNGSRASRRSSGSRTTTKKGETTTDGSAPRSTTTTTGTRRPSSPATSKRVVSSRSRSNPILPPTTPRAEGTKPLLSSSSLVEKTPRSEKMIRRLSSPSSKDMKPPLMSPTGGTPKKILVSPSPRRKIKYIKRGEDNKNDRMPKMDDLSSTTPAVDVSSMEAQPGGSGGGGKSPRRSSRSN